MTPLTRRRFLQTSSLAALALAAPRVRARTTDSPFRNLVSPDKKLRIASIGCGGKAYSDILACAGEDIVALCDVDYETGARTFREFPQAARYRDYRQMLEEMHDQIDAVIVTTPDHTHYPAALMAIERGKHVYVQKPLTHTIAEARNLQTAARKAGVVTQMGNQGHANNGTRLTKEWIEAGLIGAVREVHCWTNRPIWPQGMPLPTPVESIPPTMDWNLWLGVAPVRDYSPKIAPFNWRGYWNYGCGALGDMGCHLMDAPFWALDLRGPVRVSALSEGSTDVTCPHWSIVTYEFPARGSLPPVKLIWYDGNKMPPAPAELMPNEQLPHGGAIYRGDKGVILARGDYGQAPALLPEAKWKDFRDWPAQRIPRIPGENSQLEWIAACKGVGPAPGSNIPDYSADLSTMVLLGNVAIRAGRPINWDPVHGRCTNDPEADRFLNKVYRLF